MIRRRLAAFLHRLADRIEPHESYADFVDRIEPHESYADFVERLRREHEVELVQIALDLDTRLAKVRAIVEGRPKLRRVK